MDEKVSNFVYICNIWPASLSILYKRIHGCLLIRSQTNSAISLEICRENIELIRHLEKVHSTALVPDQRRVLIHAFLIS